MRILFVVHGYKPAYRIGGPVLSVSALAEQLVANGHTVVVFTTNSNLDKDLAVKVNTPINVDGVEVWYFERKARLKFLASIFPYFGKSIGFLYTPEMKRQLKKQISQFDIVHTHMPFVYPTYIAGRIAKKFRKPLFYHQRGVFDPARLNFRSWKKKIYIDLFEKPTLRYATNLIALSKKEIESYKLLGVDEDRVSVIPNGVNASLYDNIVEKTDTEKESLVILFLARLHPVKGADRLLNAFMAISKQYSRAILVMAGPDEFGIEDSFQRQAHERGLSNRVIFPGMIMGEKKKYWLSRADLFCLPSDAEGFSMAILEAMASSTAVLITPGCNFPEIEEANAGLIVQNSESSIAEGLRTMLSDSQKLRQMGENAREFVARKYTWAKITESMTELYVAALSKNKHEHE